MIKIKLMLFISAFILCTVGNSQNKLSIHLSLGGGATVYKNKLRDIIFTDENGNIIANGNLVTTGAGPSIKLQPQLLFQPKRYDKLYFGIGFGYQRDFIDKFRTTSSEPDVFKPSSADNTSSIYEIEYYAIIGYRLYENEKWSGALNFNAGSYFLNSDIEEANKSYRYLAAFELNFNRNFSETTSFMIKPRYEFEYLLAQPDLGTDYHWNIANYAIMAGISKRF